MRGRALTLELVCFAAVVCCTTWPSSIAPPYWHIPAASWSTSVPVSFHNPWYPGRPSNPNAFSRQRSCLSSPRPGMTPHRTRHRVRFANDPASQHHHDLRGTSGRHGLSYSRGRPFQAAQQTRTGAFPESNADMHGIFEARTNLRHNPPRPVVTGRSPPLHGVFEVRTEERHRKENRNIGFPTGHNPNRTSPHSGCNTPRPRTPTLPPHPFLAPPSLALIYDLRLPPSTVSFPPTSPSGQYQYHQLMVPMHSRMPRRVRLISEDFPWSFDLDSSCRMAGAPARATAVMDTNGRLAGDPTIITCLDVLSSLHSALQKPLGDVEWGAADDCRRQSILRARERRLNIRLAPTVTHAQHILSSSGSSGSSPAPTTARSNRVLRVDWLGSKVAFGGLVRDDAFAQRRRLPGSEETLETWVVRFRKLP